MTTPITNRLGAVFPLRVASAALLMLASATFALAADAPQPAAPAAPKPTTDDETILLSPFEVKADTDNSYGALQSNSLTAFRMDLEKMPATAQVFTQTFMDDMAATSIQDVLINYTGTVTADPNNTGAALAMPGDRDGSGGALGIRGLQGSAPKRDGFLGVKSSNRGAFGLNDTYSLERIELIEGPQSLLYGAVGGGGVINTVSKRAQFNRQRGSVQLRFDGYGSKRSVFDYNVGKGNVAARVVAVGDSSRNYRYNLGSDSYGLYAQLAFRLGANTTLRLYRDATTNWSNVNFNPSGANLNNFFYQKDASGNLIRGTNGLPVVNTTDPRRGKDVRYLALTGQLTDLQGSLSNGPVDYQHISSYGAWWSSELIRNRYNGLTLESTLPHNFAFQLTAIYSETIDDRFTVGKNIVPAAGYTGAGANPFNSTAVQIGSPGDNWQSDRTKGVRLTVVHEGDFNFWRLRGHSQTALGIEGSHQGPAFGSSGIDRLYYQADANWNPIISPTVKTDYGRVPLSNIYFPIQNGLPLRPLFQPGSRRITINGQNYVLEPRIRQDLSTVTPQNPFGLVPNNPGSGTGYAGNWNRGGETHDRLMYLANFTDWYDGKLTTIAGLNVNRFTTLNSGPGNAPTYLAPRNYIGWQVGATYRLLPGLRAFAALSTAGLSAGTTKDFYGNSLKVPKAAPAPEIGLRYNSPDQRIGAQLSYNPSTKVENETRNAGSDPFNAVNPNGINGRYNSGDQWINLDRKAQSIELALTANPTRNWRMRLAGSKIDGEITSSVSYKQLYNDQFSVNGGNVTYKDGTPVLVSPTGTGAATTPLTLAMINDPTNPYWANPDADSGSITNGVLKTALTTVDPVHGAAATGVTGLPISAIQYNFANPHAGVIQVVNEGDKNTGFNEYNFNFQNNYTFESGWLKGVSVISDVQTYWKNRAYYTSYFPTTTSSNALQATRVLYRLPTATVLGLGVSYKFKFAKKYTWSTQLNIRNLLNHYRVWVVPSLANGANLAARLSTQPRQFIWTNSVSF